MLHLFLSFNLHHNIGRSSFTPTSSDCSLFQDRLIVRCSNIVRSSNKMTDPSSTLVRAANQAQAQAAGSVVGRPANWRTATSQEIVENNRGRAAENLRFDRATVWQAFEAIARRLSNVSRPIVRLNLADWPISRLSMRSSMSSRISPSTPWSSSEQTRSRSTTSSANDSPTSSPCLSLFLEPEFFQYVRQAACPI